MKSEAEVKAEIAALEKMIEDEQKYLRDPWHYTSAGGVDPPVRAAQQRLNGAQARLDGLLWVLRPSGNHQER